MVGGKSDVRAHQQGSVLKYGQLQVFAGRLHYGLKICVQTVTDLVKEQIASKLLKWVAELSEKNKKVRGP